MDTPFPIDFAAASEFSSNHIPKMRLCRLELFDVIDPQNAKHCMGSMFVN